MFERRYLNAVILDNSKDATLVSGMEGYGHVDVDMNTYYPVTLVIRKPRRYLNALMVSLKYSRMGLFNCIIKQ